ncbi:FHA domain-containing protein [bacterium]|nr:FHA domain-containing protein [bacterium]
MANSINGNFSALQPNQPARTGTRISQSKAVQIPEPPGDVAANLPSGFALVAGDFRFEIPGNRPVTVGRLPGSDLELGDPSVSRAHAKMRIEDGRVLICDLGSSNGTTINGYKMEPNKWYGIPDGARVNFADFEVKLRSPQGTPPPLTTSAAANQGITTASQCAHAAVGGIAGYLLQSSAGPQFLLQQDGQYALGRGPENGLKLSEDLKMSRQHGRVALNQGQLAYMDTGSTNGSLVNGRRVEPNKWVPLPPNSKITMGDTVIQLSGLSAPPSLPNQALAAGLGAAAGAVGGPIGAALQTGLQLSDLNALANKTELETKGSYMASISRAQAALSQESGIVDLPKGVPTLVLSDIHARRDFIMKALEHEVDGVKVFDLLKQGKINLVCVGDGMHAEGRAAERWQQAERDMLTGKQSAAMHQEMIEGFGTMKMVMDLKSEFPENFHFCRGNHDEIKGNFAKYARTLGEASMVQSWVEKNMGQDFLDQYAKFEEHLPLVVRGEGFVASHAAPGGKLDGQAVQARDHKAFMQLAWTENRDWNDQDASVQQRFQQNLQAVGAEGKSWLVGHRPVEDGNYRSQFNGQLVQINAPNDFVVALVPADGKFVPDRDVISLGR